MKSEATKKRATYVITSLHIFDQSLNHVTPHFNIALFFVNYE